MPKRTNPFQHLIALIERSTRIGNVTVTESEELVDKITGDLREVDILLRSSISNHPFLIGIECRGGGIKPRPVSVEWVEEMWGKHRSLPTDKLILVAKAGFTESAKKKATWLGLDCYSLDDAQHLDWSAKIRALETIRIEHFMLPYITHVNLIFDEKILQGMEKNDISLEKPSLIGPDGQIIDANEMTQTWIKDPSVIEHLKKIAFTDDDTVFEFERDLQGTTIVGNSGKKYPVRGISVKGICRKVVQEVNLSQSTYNKTAVAIGASRIFKNDLQYLITENEGNNPIATFSVSKQKDKEET